MRVGAVTMGGTSGGSRGQVDGGAPGGGGEQPAGVAQTGGRSLLPHPGGACGPHGWRAAPRTHVRADFPGPRAPARGRGEHRAGVPPPPAQPLVRSWVPLPTSHPPAPRPGVRGFLRAAGHAAEQTRVSGHQAWWAGADRKPATPRVEELWVASSSRWTGDARRTQPGSPLAVGTPHSCREAWSPRARGTGHHAARVPAPSGAGLGHSAAPGAGRRRPARGFEGKAAFDLTAVAWPPPSAHSFTQPVAGSRGPALPGGVRGRGSTPRPSFRRRSWRDRR